MIVLRQKEKEFSRRPLPPEGFLDIPDDWKENSEGLNIDIDINQKLYEEAVRVLGPIHKQMDDTHMLEDFSKENFIVMTKSITPIDRFIYRVYRPILDRTKKEVVIRIVVCSYLNHINPEDKLKSYSENGE